MYNNQVTDIVYLCLSLFTLLAYVFIPLDIDLFMIFTLYCISHICLYVGVDKLRYLTFVFAFDFVKY